MFYVPVPTEAISGLVQEKLFDLGYRWPEKGTEINDFPSRKHGSNAVLYLHKESGHVKCGSKGFAEKRGHVEVSISYVFNDLNKVDQDIYVETTDGCRLPVQFRKNSKGKSAIRVGEDGDTGVWIAVDTAKKILARMEANQ